MKRTGAVMLALFVIGTRQLGHAICQLDLSHPLSV